MIGRAAFLERFFIPLVAGGEVHVGAPIGGRGLARLVGGAGDRALELRLQEMRRAVAGEWRVDAPPPPLVDREALRLASAVHDLLFLHHPSAGPPIGASERARVVGTGAVKLATLPRAWDAETLVARHTVLHLFPSLSRTDVRVSFWAGKQDFRGQEPPRSMLTWPTLRRVREERSRVNCLAESAVDARGGAEVVRALLASSPLTNLANPLRAEPRLDLATLCDVLGDAEPCRMVVQAWLEIGLARVGPVIAEALCLLLATSNARASEFALSLLSHLHLCALVGAPRGAAQSELLRVATRGEAGLRDFCGLYAAVHRVAPVLAAPPDVRADHDLSARVAEHAVACASIVGPARAGELVELVARGLGVSPAWSPTRSGVIAGGSALG